MPSRSAISISVSLAGAVISRPSSVKVTIGYIDRFALGDEEWRSWLSFQVTSFGKYLITQSTGFGAA